MMKNIYYFFLIMLSLPSYCQIKGSVTDEKGNPLPSVSINIEDTYIGTTTNDLGHYELRVDRPGKYVLVFHYLGFRSQKMTVDVGTNVRTVDVKLVEENVSLNEVVVNKKDNPANKIIRSAIAAKAENSEKTSKYQADFYSRGIFRIKDAPKKILGKKIDMFDDVLDSTRSGILYLSETVSKISFQKPDKLKETIIASKVSGHDNGYSYNNAASANFDLYDNYIELQINVVSPIADNAFNYYKYKLEGSFFTEDNQQVNKIKVVPRRESEPAMTGYIYILEDSWAIYGADLTIRGDQMQTPALNSLTIKQSFLYNSNNKIWVKNTQTLDFLAGIFGINVSGRFTYVYSNFVFDPKFDKKTFTREILSFANEANKKDTIFWNSIRPVPLTKEETNDYLKKGLLQIKKKSRSYLDSIDAKSNKLGAFDVLTGYTYKNSYRKWELGYDGFIKKLSYNTVQGWRLNTGLYYSKRNEEKRTLASVNTNFNYGLSERKFRGTATYTQKFSNITQSEVRVSGGSSVAQFNPENPIGTFINSFRTLFFKVNYMKIYERNYADLFYTREVLNGLVLNGAVDYSERVPLFNTTDFVIIKNKKVFTSNNPLLPDDYTTTPFEKHNLVTATFGARINFAQEYWSRPDGKFNLRNEKYPTLFLGYEKGFAGSDKKYDFDHIHARLVYDITIGNKGNLGMNITAGKFYNSQNISFVDYKHFNGNQTHVNKEERYLNVFNLLPYYVASTNDSYIEAHFEHDDRGYIMNKIPLLNKLESNLILGFHNLVVPQRRPYSEVSVGLDNLGIGKFRLFRLDYVRSFQKGTQSSGIIFGLKFLNVLE